MSNLLSPIRTLITALGPSDILDASVVIPARNEQRRIGACLDALAVAITSAHPLVTGLLIVVNNSDDSTCDRVLAWAVEHSHISVQIIDCEFPPSDAHAGAARRFGLDFALKRLKSDGILFTSDADSRVRPDWITSNLTALRDADLICGAFAADQEEARLLPAAVDRHCQVESDYMSIAVRLAAVLDPVPHDPDPPHLNASGASLAFTRKLYETVGGMPAIDMSEDRAFAALAERHDFRVRHSKTIMVDTSCRMTGRTIGGMAGALRERAIEVDPVVDQWLEPAANFARRYHLRGRLRNAWPNPTALRGRLATALGVEESTRLMRGPLPDTFGAFLEQVEAKSTVLTRVRMRISDCHAELPELVDIYAGLSSADPSFAGSVQPKRQAR